MIRGYQKLMHSIRRHFIEATKQKGKSMQEILNKVVQDFPEIKLYIVPQIYSDQLSKTDATDCLYLNELFF